MVRIDEKTLSVNEAWKGSRYKSDAYKTYTTKLLYLLPRKIDIPEPPFEIYFRFGFSSAASDWDNPVKPLQDILAKKYGFNDKLIRRGVVDTEIVRKGQEFFEFELRSFVAKYRPVLTENRKRVWFDGNLPPTVNPVPIVNPENK